MFGFEGITVPDYFKYIAKWFIDDTLDRQDLIRALTYLGGGAAELRLGSYPDSVIRSGSNIIENLHLILLIF